MVLTKDQTEVTPTFYAINTKGKKIETISKKTSDHIPNRTIYKVPVSLFTHKTTINSSHKVDTDNLK